MSVKPCQAHLSSGSGWGAGARQRAGRPQGVNPGDRAELFITWLFGHDGHGRRLHMRHRFEPTVLRPCSKSSDHMVPLPTLQVHRYSASSQGSFWPQIAPRRSALSGPPGPILPLGPCLVNRARANLLGPSRQPRSCGAHRRRPQHPLWGTTPSLGGQALPRPPDRLHARLWGYAEAPLLRAPQL